MADGVSGRRLLLVGCGKMGGALLSGWLDRGLDPRDTRVVEPHDAQVATAAGVAVADSASALDAAFVPDAVVFAVKPQGMDAVLPDYRHYAGQGAVFLSIAAGRTIASIARSLGADAAIVRVMPNTPAAVGRGISVLCANDRVGAPQAALCESLLAAVGEAAWVDDEAMMDAVTAVSGSGPAYVFLLIEALEEAAVAVGLPADLAARLARVTVTGSGELARLSPETAAVLRRNVTSPGGTTEAALEVLMAADGLKALMARAVAAAERRSRELAQ